MIDDEIYKNSVEETINNGDDSQNEANDGVSGKEMRKYYAASGWRFTVGIAAIFAFQIIFQFIAGLVVGIAGTLGVNIPIPDYISYLLILFGDSFGMLILLLLFRKREKSIPQKRKMKFGWWVLLLICLYGVMGLGNIIGTVVNGAILLPFSSKITDINAAAGIFLGSTSWAYIIVGIIVGGILGPVLEELIFRKIFIDNYSKYGMGAAILLSGLTFGLFHGNFSQFFYAFGVGIVFAYIYSLTGKVKYTIFLHIGINSITAVIVTIVNKLMSVDFNIQYREYYSTFIETMDTEAFMQNINNLVSAYPLAAIGLIMNAVVTIVLLALYIIGFILGIVLLITKFRKYRKTLDMGVKGSKTAATFNWGMIIFIVMSICLFIYYYAMNIIPVIIQWLK